MKNYQIALGLLVLMLYSTACGKEEDKKDPTPIVNEPPSAPELSSPNDGVIDVITNETLSWQASVDPEEGNLSYSVFVGEKNPPTTELVKSQSGLTYKCSLKNNTKYYWQIVVKDSRHSVKSEVRSFTTGAITDFLTIPEDKSTKVKTKLEAEWNDVAGVSTDNEAAEKYDVYLGKSKDNLSKITIDKDSYTYNAAGKIFLRTEEILDIKETYYYKVVAKFDDGEKSSEVRQFETAGKKKGEVKPADKSALIAEINIAVREQGHDSPDLNYIDTSLITDMSKLLEGVDRFFQFNGKMGEWDVSNVTNMENMFVNADGFNQDIGGWNVSNVTNMQSMFFNADLFNQDIGEWNVSNVTNMENMFFNADSFNQDIGEWNVSNVTNMGSMFLVHQVLSKILDRWMASKITYSNP